MIFLYLGSSACCPLPGDLWLTIGWLVREHIDSLVGKFISSIVVVGQEVQVASIIIVTVTWVAEIDDSALLDLTIAVAHMNALVTELIVVHTADAIDGNKAF